MSDRKWGRIINIASTAASVGSLTNLEEMLIREAEYLKNPAKD